jgi:hypothetical protein
MTAISFTNYQKVYNSLPDDVDKRFARLVSLEAYTNTIHEGLNLIRRHGADGYLGLFLLHRHFTAPRGTLFLERPHTPPVAGHRTTLVTAPASREALPSGFVPHRFRIGRHGKLQPLEFTTDRLAAQAWKRLQGKRRLLKNLGRHLAARRFDALLGVGIYPRKANVKTATRVYLEETDFERKISVVHVLPSLPRVAGRLIPTLWTIRDAGNGCCTQVCIAYCSHPQSGIGYCGHRDGGHVGCV